MMIWFFRAIVIAGCTALGFYKGEKARARHRALAELRRAMVELRSSVRDAVVLPEALCALSHEKLSLAGARMLKDPSLAFEDAFEAPDAWSAQDRDALVYAMSLTTKMLREERTLVFQDAIENLDERIAEAGNTGERTAKLWQKLGLLGGIGVVLLTL